MPTINLELTWEQFHELRLLCEAIGHARDLGADEGALKNNIIDGDWNPTKVKLKIKLT